MRHTTDAAVLDVCEQVATLLETGSPCPIELGHAALAAAYAVNAVNADANAARADADRLAAAILDQIEDAI